VRRVSSASTWTTSPSVLASLSSARTRVTLARRLATRLSRSTTCSVTSWLPSRRYRSAPSPASRPTVVSKAPGGMRSRSDARSGPSSRERSSASTWPRAARTRRATSSAAAPTSLTTTSSSPVRTTEVVVGAMRPSGTAAPLPAAPCAPGAAPSLPVASPVPGSTPALPPARFVGREVVAGSPPLLHPVRSRAATASVIRERFMGDLRSGRAGGTHLTPLRLHPHVSLRSRPARPPRRSAIGRRDS